MGMGEKSLLPGLEDPLNPALPEGNRESRILWGRGFRTHGFSGKYRHHPFLVWSCSINSIYLYLKIDIYILCQSLKRQPFHNKIPGFPG
jgi:hypothetical protein